MAEVAYTATRPQAGGNVVKYAWAGLTDGDTGDVVDLMGLSGLACSVQITAATGGAVTMQVSLDGTNWETMKDTGGNDVTAAAGATAYFDVSTAALYAQPLGGTSLTDGDLMMVVREALE